MVPVLLIVIVSDIAINISFCFVYLVQICKGVLSFTRLYGSAYVLKCLILKYNYSLTYAKIASTHTWEQLSFRCVAQSSMLCDFIISVVICNFQSHSKFTV